MHSRSKSTSSLTSSPKKQRISLGRTDSNRSGNSDISAGCLPSMTTKEVHATTNAFYAQMLEAQKKKDVEVDGQSKREKIRRSNETDKRRRGVSEEPITALPSPSPTPEAMDFPKPITKTPRKKRSNGLLQLVPDGSQDAVPTQRAIIEARKEKKIMDMLARDVPMSPAAVAFEEDPLTITYDQKSRIAEKSAGSTSPKKRFLGLNISMPSFMGNNTEVSEPSAATLMLPPPLPPPPALKKPNAGVTGLRKRADSRVIELKQQEGVSLLPSKVRQLKHLYDGDTLVDDSSTLGRYGGSPAPRSISDGVTAVLHKKTSLRNMGDEEALRRSKSVLHARDADAETIPPTPPAKNTPPKVIVQESTPNNKTQNKFAATVEPGDEDTTPIKGVKHLRNDYLNLIQKAPSMYSLHGDIQHLPGSQSAGVLDHSMVKREEGEGEILKPDVYEGRWSERQAPLWKERPKQQQHHGNPQSSPPRNSIAPIYYSPSVYSLYAGSPEDARKQRVQPVYFCYQHPQFGRRASRPIHPSEESSKTLTFKASESVLGAADKRDSPDRKSEEEDPDATMVVNSREDSLPSRELAHSPAPSSDVTMPTMPKHTERRDSVTNGATKGISSSADGQASDEDKHNGTRDSMSTSDYYPPDVAQYPTTMPTPLFGRQGRFGPNMPISPPPGFTTALLPTPPPGYSGPIMMPPPCIMPDGSNMLTHFDVLNRHIMDAATGLHRAQDSNRDHILLEMQSKHIECQTAKEEQVTAVKQSFDKLESHLSASTTTAGSVLNKAEQVLEHVRNDLGPKLGALVDQNIAMLSRFDTMQKHIADLNKKLDEQHAAIVTDVARAVQNSMSVYLSQSSMGMPQQSPHSMVQVVDHQGRIYMVTAAQMQQMQQQASGQGIYGSYMAGGRDERSRKSDELAGGQSRGGGGYGGDYSRRYDAGLRSGSDQRLGYEGH